MTATLRLRLRLIFPVLAALVLAAGTLQVVSVSASGAPAYSGPIVITQGGTYTGNWQSTDPARPAVTVATSEPVVIESSRIRSASDLILGAAVVNLTVRNSFGEALNPNRRGQVPGRFVALDGGFVNFVAENNTLLSTSGMWLLNYSGNHTPSQTVRVVRNRATNIDGRASDGNGGFLTGEGDQEFVQFLQLDKVSNVPYMEIAWNEIVNEPGNSRVEDNISFYSSGGTSGSAPRSTTTSSRAPTRPSPPRRASAGAASSSVMPRTTAPAATSTSTTTPSSRPPTTASASSAATTSRSGATTWSPAAR